MAQFGLDPTNFNGVLVTYTAPVEDMHFVLDALCDLDHLSASPKFSDVSADLYRQILSETGKLGSEVFAPLNYSGDRQGSVLENGVVRTPDGFRDAYRAFQEGGWNSIPHPPEFGGMGLPVSLSMAVQEVWQAANMGLALCPLLGQSAALALVLHGTDEQKRDYLPKLVSGEWTGAMDLTEPQAGSDVGALRTKAAKDGDHYRITGQKIFISYGDHDLTENIIHLVLARTEGAPSGTKGISLFLVPKYPLNSDGSLGPANDMRAVSLEEKMGIHASPTAVMSFGDGDGAIGYLVGQENGGMACMFTMMNIARLGVGIQGLAVAERAYQRARTYARERVQSRTQDSDGPVPIIKHPDVRRMLMSMKAQVEAMRVLAYTTIAAGDMAEAAKSETDRARYDTRLALLTPVVKAWCSDLGFEVASLGVQVHGGAGYIEESGAAQHLRDARITGIYEGTNGIQAVDLMGRKILHDKGAAIADLVGEMRETVDGVEEADLVDISQQLESAINELEETVSWILARGPDERPLLSAIAVPFLHLLGTVTAGWLMMKATLAARRAAAGDAAGVAAVSAEFAAGKTATTEFYMANIMPRCRSLAGQVCGGGPSVIDVDEDLL
jgi:alkylation response protein AidB-like acyl-CoA dehydrogenase